MEDVIEQILEAVTVRYLEGGFRSRFKLVGIYIVGC